VLVLSRRPRDAIMIGHDIVVTVLSISRDHVRIGIQAPAHVEVHRQEVYLAIEEANRQASSSAGGSIETLSAMVPGRRGKPGAGTTPADGPAAEAASKGPAQAEGDKGTATP